MDAETTRLSTEIERIVREDRRRAHDRWDEARQVSSTWFSAVCERVDPLIPAERKAEFLDLLEAMLAEAGAGADRIYRERLAEEIPARRRAAYEQYGIEEPDTAADPTEPESLFDY